MLRASRSLAFRAGSAAGLLYRFALINYFVIFLNLMPLLELDGYWILADLIQVPDLRQRSLQFIQHDLWHKLRTRERLTKQEIGLGLYAGIGVVFTLTCFYTAYFFWKRTFGGLISSLWNGGLGSRLLLVLLVVFLAGPVLRGLFQLLRALYRRGRGILRKVVFRAESKWRVEAAELIDALPVFEDLPVEILNDLAGRVRLKPIRAGQPVFRQGDRPNAFYVIRQGTFAVEEEDPASGDVQVLDTLARGDSFGEMGLLEAAPRAATVRALEEGELFGVDKGTFDRLLSDSIDAPAFGPTMQALAELRDMPAFSRPSERRSCRSSSPTGRGSPPLSGDTIVEQGAVGDAFFADPDPGQVDIVRDGSVIGRRAGTGESLRRDRAAPRRAQDRQRRGEDAGPRVPPGPRGVRLGSCARPSSGGR